MHVRKRVQTDLLSPGKLWVKRNAVLELIDEQIVIFRKRFRNEQIGISREKWSNGADVGYVSGQG